MTFLAIVIAAVALIYVALQFTFMIVSGLLMLFLISLVGTVYAGAAACLATVFFLNGVFPDLSGWWIALFSLITGIGVIVTIVQTITAEVKKKYQMLVK